MTVLAQGTHGRVGADPSAVTSSRIGNSGGPVRVLICDDSLTIRGAITRMLRAESDLEVVGSVRDGKAAIAAVQTRPASAPIDVVVLDIEMPVMDGLTALPLILKIDPTIRVIMASTLTLRGASITLESLALGAADYVPKPSTTGQFGDDEFRAELVAKVRGLGRLRQRERVRPPVQQIARKDTGPVVVAGQKLPFRPMLLAIGSSTGGPQALFTFFKALGPSLRLPVVLTQHMPASFVPLLADQITRLGGMPCREAVDGQVLQSDQIAIAPGGRHLAVNAGPKGLTASLSDGPAENFCKPAVDVMLRSAAVAAHGKVLIVMLTGMGRDGLAGTRTVVEAGGLALAQDEDSSVVWGMPGAIATAGLCRNVLPLASLAGAVRDLVCA